MARIVSAQPLVGYRLRLRFTDGLEGTVDLRHLIGRGVFQQLADPAEFQRVFVDPETQTIAWPNDIDICPDTLYQDVVAEKRRETERGRRTVGLSQG